MKLFKFARFASLLLFSFVLFYSSQSSAQYCPECIVVTGVRTSSDTGLINQSQQSPNTGSYYSGISPEAYKQKQEAEAAGQAYGVCLGNTYAAKATCDRNANDNLLANQATCTKVGASMAGVTAGTGILISLTGVGSVVGALITVAAGTTGTMIYNQCNNVAQNISNNSKVSCEESFNQSKTKCEAIKP